MTLTVADNTLRRIIEASLNEELDKKLLEKVAVWRANIWLEALRKNNVNRISGLRAEILTTTNQVRSKLLNADSDIRKHC